MEFLEKELGFLKNMWKVESSAALNLCYSYPRVALSCYTSLNGTRFSLLL